MAHEIRSILLYTDGEVMGDGIIRLPYIAALKHHFPHAAITRLASDGSVYDGALRTLAQPYFHAALRTEKTIKLRDYLFRPAVLRHQHFDLIIDTQRKIKRSLWLKRIPHGIFVSASAGYRFSDKKPVKAAASPRILDQLVQLTEAAIGTALMLKPIALPDPQWAAAAQSILPHGQNYVGFAVGAGHTSKCWPLERFIALAHRVAHQGHCPVFFLGPNEQDKQAPLRDALPSALFPLSMQADCDTKNPCFTLALAARLTVAIANDSGGCHLLAAGGSPLVALFRAASVREKFLPTAPRVIALSPEDFGGHPGIMADIPEAAAQKALDDLLGQ